MVYSEMLRRMALARTRATQRNIQEDAILHSHRRENLKTYKNIAIIN
jgi:phage host-nuclease inhibitor protein Gam